MKTAHRSVTLPEIEGARIAVLQSKWYREYSDVMLKKCTETLAPTKAAPVDTYLVSGCLEMPLAARRILRLGKNYEALITFGIVVKGETYHFEMIVNECMRGLGTVMMEEDTPIIVEVLPVTDIAHAKARCADDEFNKGIEAAVAAAETIAWRRKYPAGLKRSLGY